MTPESRFQSRFIKRVKETFPGCFVMKNDAGYCQGVPDFLVLYGPHWAMLEFKRSHDAGHRPNQDYYVERFGQMSYASFVYPENEEEVIHGLQEAFRT